MKSAKRFKEYVKYTLKELESYTQTAGSCVCKVNTDLHFSMGPYVLADFKHALHTHIVRRKVGHYDARLDGIILDIKNIKVLSHDMAMRGDDGHLHVNVNADCYVFRPMVGEVLSGAVKHIGNHHVGVIIYRVFNASIRFAHKVDANTMEYDQELRFRIKDFNLQNVFPYIEGELVDETNVPLQITAVKAENDSTLDSGIEERDVCELDELLNDIKKEQQNSYDAWDKAKQKSPKKRKLPTEDDESPAVTPQKRKKTSKKTATEETDSETPAAKVKSASNKGETKKKKKQTDSPNIKIKEEVVEET